jgi:hypothetical protein
MLGAILLLVMLPWVIFGVVIQTESQPILEGLLQVQNVNLDFQKGARMGNLYTLFYRRGLQDPEHKHKLKRILSYRFN